MFTSPLHELLLRSGARLGEYSGAQSAEVFTGVAAEFSAISEGTALSDLSWRALIAVEGDDRVRWLNGMVTNNVKDLPPQRGCYNFVLNAQGRIQGDFTAYNLGERLMLTTDRSQLEALIKLLDGYIIMDDVQLKDLTSSQTAIGIQGSRAADALTTLGLRVPCSALTIEPQTIEGMSVTLLSTDDENSYELWVRPDAAEKVWRSLASAGATPCGFAALELRRIRMGRPRFGADIRARDLPQETDQTRALNFQKGCYVGQEIVERIRSRGAVHRRLTQFRLSASIPVGSHIQLAGKDVGEITSVAQFPSGEILALGYIRREAENAGALTAADANVALTEAAVVT